jgi:malonate transporter and related proteins
MTLFVHSLPIFLIILLGYLLVRFKVSSSSTSGFLVNLLFFVIMPITLFSDIAKLPIHQTLNWPYMGAYFCASLSVMVLSFFTVRIIHKLSTRETLIALMASTQTNTAYLALPLFLFLFHTITPVASIILVQVIFNFAFLLGLEISKTQTRHYWRAAITTLWKAPILIGILLGLGASYIHLSLPHIIEQSFKMVSNSAIFLALLALGMSLAEPREPRSTQENIQTLWIILLKSIIHPVVAFLLGRYVFELSGFTLTALTLMASMPTAKNVFVFAKRYQAGADRANVIVLTTTCISVVSTNLILYWMQ